MASRRSKPTNCLSNRLKSAELRFQVNEKEESHSCLKNALSVVRVRAEVVVPVRKVCSFCVDKIEYIDYKDINRLRRFVNERGKILPAA